MFAKNALQVAIGMDINAIMSWITSVPKDIHSMVFLVLEISFLHVESMNS